MQTDLNTSELCILKESTSEVLILLVRMMETPFGHQREMLSTYMRTQTFFPWSQIDMTHFLRARRTHFTNIITRSSTHSESIPIPPGNWALCDLICSDKHGIFLCSWTRPGLTYTKTWTISTCYCWMECPCLWDSRLEILEQEWMNLNVPTSRST